MSESEDQHNFEGISWEKELEDDSLAVLQEKIRNEFGTDFETLDYDAKGFSKQNSLPFYSDLEGEIDFSGETFNIEIQRDGGINEFEFWADDLEALELLDSYLEDYTASNNGEEILEPYKYREIMDTKVLELLDVLDRRFEMQGPHRRPGNGQPRTYQVRREHLEQSSDYLKRQSDDIQVIGNLEEQDQEIKIGRYSNQQEYLPGDARFCLELEENTDTEIEGEITIKPERRPQGHYKVELSGEDRLSQTYLVNIAEDVLNL